MKCTINYWVCLVVGVMLLAAGCGGGEQTPSSVTEEQRRSIDARTAGFLVKAQEAFEHGAYNQALVFTDSVRKRAPEYADTYFLRGQIYTSLRRLDLAKKAYNRVLELDPNYRGVWLNLGNTAFREGEYDLALKRYRQALANYPSAELRLMMGRAYEKRHQADSALYAYEQAAELDSSAASAYLRMGQVYKDQGELARAVQMSEKGVRLAPERVEYRYTLGSLLVLNGQPQEAVEHLQMVVDSLPWHYWAHENLGRALMQLGREEDARHHFDRGEQLQENLAEVDHWRAQTQANPDQLVLWAKLNRALQKMGRREEAREIEKVASSLAPRQMIRRVPGEMASKQNRLAGRDIMQGEVDRAIQRFQNVLDQTPGQPALWHNLGIARAAAGQVEEARQAWEKVLDLAPGYRPAASYLEQLSQSYKPAGAEDDSNTLEPGELQLRRGLED